MKLPLKAGVESMGFAEEVAELIKEHFKGRGELAEKTLRIFISYHEGGMSSLEKEIEKMVLDVLKKGGKI